MAAGSGYVVSEPEQQTTKIVHVENGYTYRNIF